MQIASEKKMLALLVQRLNDSTNPYVYSLKRKEVNAFLEQHGWAKKINDLLRMPTSVTWKRVLELSRDTLDYLCEMPDEGWLNFTLHFAIDLMFPKEEFALRRSKFSDGAVFLLTLMQLVYDEEKKAGLIPKSVEFSLLNKSEVEGESTAVEYNRLT